MARKTERRVDEDSKALLQELVDDYRATASLAETPENRKKYDRAAYKLCEFVHGNIDRIFLYDA